MVSASVEKASTISCASAHDFVLSLLRSSWSVWIRSASIAVLCVCILFAMVQPAFMIDI